VHAAQPGTEFSMYPERRLDLRDDVLEATRLQAGARRFGIAVHRVANPQHRAAGGAHRLDQRRQALVDVLDAHAMDQYQTAGLVARIECRDQTLHPLGAHRWTDLDADRVGDAAEELDVRSVQRRSAHADPRHVRREVVPALLAIDEARLRLLVWQVQPLV